MVACSKLFEGVAEELVSLKQGRAATAVELQQQHKTMLKHTHTLAEEVSRLGDSCQLLGAAHSQQQAGLQELAEGLDDCRATHAEDVDGLREKLRHGHSSHDQARGYGSCCAPRVLLPHSTPL